MDNGNLGLPEDFSAPRQCFAIPPQEVYQAVELLDTAADLILAGEHGKAAALITEADKIEVYTFVCRIWGPTDVNIHRYRAVPGAPPKLKTTKERMPAARVKQDIHLRDGWQCRFCGIRVIWPAALTVIRKMFPDVVRWGSRDAEIHSAFLALKAVVDHILPHSRGGDNDPYNLVTTCGPCNYGRSYWTLEEVGLADPRLRPPVVDGWDGLTRLGRLIRPA